MRKRRAQALEKPPAKMRRVVLVEASEKLRDARLEVQEIDTPKPRSGQVLVKVDAAPINPSDDGVWKVKPKQGYPVSLGNEASGTVVASGGGFLAGRLLGKKVAIIGGTSKYAEYAVVSAMTEAFQLPPQVPVEDGCAYFINPFTVVGIVETVKAAGCTTFIHTAAASQLGQMMVKYCKQEGVRVVNLVRREEQAEVLRRLGAEHIVITGKDGWQSELEQLIKDLKIKCAFDAIAGDMTGTLLSMLPPGGSVWVYGRLAPEPVGQVQPLDLIYRGKKLQGWLLTAWLMKGGPLRALVRSIRTSAKVGKYLTSVFASDFQDTSLKDMHASYCALQERGRTGAKMRVRPHALV